MAGIYLHIPFCKQACHYCDFHFTTVQKGRKELIQALLKEIEIERDFLNGEIIETIYFGGGTPSLLSSNELLSILESLNRHFKIQSDAEITLEANPDDLSVEKLDELRVVGINRLSIGVQTFDDAILTRLNRAHHAAMAKTCLEYAQSAGFENITLDLMYGLPGQSLEDWKRELEIFHGFNLPHLSAYSLTIEPQTVFGHRFRKKELSLPPEETVINQFEYLMKFMSEKGYEHYEISNFAKPGHRSKHNTSYWLQKPYLGLGPSAHSFRGNMRRWNVSNNARYVESISAGTPVFEMEELSLTTQFNEYLLTSLRTIWGLDEEKIKIDFGPEIHRQFSRSIEPYLKSREVVQTGHSYVLSEKGKFVADKITSDLFHV